MIEHGRTGFLFEAGNREELAGMVGQFVRGETEPARMRQAARQEFESRYTAQRNYPMLIECYQAAAARPATAVP
jgi:glycogen synthase